MYTNTNFQRKGVSPSEEHAYVSTFHALADDGEHVLPETCSQSELHIESNTVLSERNVVAQNQLFCGDYQSHALLSDKFLKGLREMPSKYEFMKQEKFIQEMLADRTVFTNVEHAYVNSILEKATTVSEPTVFLRKVGFDIYQIAVPAMFRRSRSKLEPVYRMDAGAKYLHRSKFCNNDSDKVEALDKKDRRGSNVAHISEAAQKATQTLQDNKKRFAAMRNYDKRREVEFSDAGGVQECHIDDNLASRLSATASTQEMPAEEKSTFLRKLFGMARSLNRKLGASQRKVNWRVMGESLGLLSVNTKVRGAKKGRKDLSASVVQYAPTSPSSSLSSGGSVGVAIDRQDLLNLMPNRSDCSFPKPMHKQQEEQNLAEPHVFQAQMLKRHKAEVIKLKKGELQDDEYAFDVRKILDTTRGLIGKIKADALEKTEQQYREKSSRTAIITNTLGQS